MLNVLRERRLPTAAYPIRGFAHFLHHPQRHAGPIFLSIVKVIAASAVVVVPLYRYGFGFQHTLLERAYKAFFSGNAPQTSMDSLLIKVSSLVLCLVETSAITLQMGSHFIGNIRARLFDSVLKERNGLPRQDESDANLAMVSAKVAGPATTHDSHAARKYHFLSPRYLMILSAQQDDNWSIFFLRSALFVLTLPLNVVPVVGPLCFISIQALFRGGAAHKRYFQLYKWTPEQRQRRIEAYFWQYQRFGLVATALEMLPFVGYLFMYTNQVGAALWAMDLHDRKLLEPSASSPSSKQD
ncbi:uncharacterized protein ATC70_003724 [Mucor velutinosus]|uniref:Uncharacterized protein n=1 Tax=Mucor velutinosus TaxID=708070 RepID=A0AAN7DA40_9FUNG|nr:hypothetical protein ATC70_003724 [Mucor velutinosus]